MILTVGLRVSQEQRSLKLDVTIVANYCSSLNDDDSIIYARQWCQCQHSDDVGIAFMISCVAK